MSNIEPTEEQYESAHDLLQHGSLGNYENDICRLAQWVAEREAPIRNHCDWLTEQCAAFEDKNIELTEQLQTAMKNVAAYNTVAGEADLEHAQLRDVIRDLMHQLASTREMHMEAVAERDSLLLVSADLESRIKASSEAERQAKAERDNVHGVPASIEAITRAVRTADVDFESVGGSSRHYVRECLLPALECEGLIIKNKTDVELLPNGDGTSSHYVHSNEETTQVKP